MNQKKLRIFLLACYFFFSFLRNSIFPLMTTVQRVFLVDEMTSSLVPVFFISGFIIASLISAICIAVIGLRISIIIGTLSAIVSCLICITAGEIILYIIGIFIAGNAVGWGMLSLTAAYAHLDERIQNFGMLHASFGLGGILAPLFISFFLSMKMDFRLIFVLYIILFSALFIYIFIKKSPENTKYKSFSIKDIFSPLKKLSLVSCIIVIFLYSGIEVGIVTWAGNLFEDHFHYTKEIAALFLTSFWIFFTFGRLITDFLYFKFGKIRLVVLLCLPGIVILSLLIFIDRITAVILFSMIALILAPIFPAVQKYANSLIHEKEIGILNGLIYIFSGFGVITLTETMGSIASSGISTSFYIPIAGLILVLLTVVFGIMKIFGKKEAKQVPVENSGPN